MALRRGLEGQVALVTGGGKGIGRAIALELAARGARLVVTGRGERALGDTVGEITHGGGSARHLVGDVRDAAHVRAAVECALAAWGRIDIAVANAGTTGTVRIGEGSQAGGDDAWARTRAIVETNLLGTFHVFDAAAAAMGAGGRLIAISSVLGKLGAPGQAAYCASKAGVQGLVRAAAVELGPRSITCNAVCPGWVNTEMAQGRLAEIAAEAGQSVQAAEAAARAALPLGRFVTPEEVAGLVAFLCSAAAAAVTGQSLSICAGATAIGS